jgi:S1-C subfamily serine protease
MKDIALCLFVVFFACAQSPKVERDFKEDIQYNASCVYKIEVNTIFGGRISGSCTAFKIEEEGEGYKLYLLTARHVAEMVNPAQSGFICYNKHGRHQDYSIDSDIVRIEFVVETLGITTDTAVISSSILNKVPVAQFSTDEITPYTEVYTLGFPYGLGLHFSEGRTSYFQKDGGMWVSDAPVSHGCSGGGVFDKRTNKLIGIICEISLVRIADVGLNTSIPQFIWHLHKFVPLKALKERL